MYIIPNPQLTPSQVAEKILDIITEDPDRWNQSEWYIESPLHDGDDYTHECGTQACVAGWATVITVGRRTPTGGPASYFVAGQKALGLNEHQADWLFDCTRNKEEVITKLTEIKDAQ